MFDWSSKFNGGTLNKDQNNFNTCQRQVTDMLDKILAATAAVSSAASLGDIGTRKSLVGAGNLSWNRLRSCFIFNYKIKSNFH